MPEICGKSVLGNELFQIEVAKYLCGWLFCTDASDLLIQLYSELGKQEPAANEKPLAIWKDEKFLNPDFRELLKHKNFAFDLPVWLNADDAKIKMMIISKEPCHTNQVNLEKGSLAINMPWSLNNPKLKSIWQTFLNNSISLYFTELKKFYVNNEGEGHNKIYKVINKLSKEEIESRFYNTVSNEISIFKPDYILFVDSIFSPEYELLVEEIKSKKIPCDYIMDPVNHSATAEIYNRKTKEILSQL